VNPIQAIILGLVQGLTEFLPVSSSAHLVIVPWLLGWPDPGLKFDVALHMGTLVAVLAYFWRDWLGMIQGLLHLLTNRGPASAVTPLVRDGAPARPLSNLDLQGRLAIYIILATIPGVIAGVLLETRIDEWFHSPDRGQQATGILLIAVAVVVILLLR
jgi:undecaprenyl-diphosphatase